jgi:hypothetical protein
LSSPGDSDGQQIERNS